MKKLVIFGDSFANYSWFGENEEWNKNTSWAINLADKLNIPIVNYGVAGSSLIYSFHKFWEYFKSDQYYEDDIIIFIMTNAERTWVRSMPGPHLGVATMDIKNPWYSADDVSWINKNYDSNLWTKINILSPETNFDILQIACCFSTLAEQHKKNTWIVLRMDNYSAVERTEYLNQIIFPSDNFFPYIDENNTLFEASIKEFLTEEMFKVVLSTGDRRTNHLSKINRDKLVDMMHDVITTKNIQSFNINKFEKNIYTTDKDLEIFNEPWIFI